MNRPTFILLAVPVIAFAQGVHSHIAMIHYPVATWASAPRIAGTIHDFLPIFPEEFIRGAISTTNTSTYVDGDVVHISIDHLQGVHSELCIQEFSNFAAAKMALLEELGSMQSTILMPMGTNGLETVGDICLSDATPSSSGLTLFVRNNIVVSCDTAVSYETMTNLLFTLDSQIVYSVTNGVALTP